MIKLIIANDKLKMKMKMKKLQRSNIIYKMLIIKLEINNQILIESITIISQLNTMNKLIIMRIGLPVMMKKINIINKSKNKIIKYQKPQRNEIIN